MGIWIRERFYALPYLLKVWKEQIQKAKDLYEEAKAASASQIDRFYLSYCGGNTQNSTGLATERSNNNYPVVNSVPGDPDQDSDQVTFN